MGNLSVTSEPSEITTVLGSCVAICLWDQRLGIGGMNHFKAPHVPSKKKPSDMYGEIALKNLISGMLELGSRKGDLRAMLFGGGSVIEKFEGQPNIGRENIRFAREALDVEGIPVQSFHTGHNFGRKIAFNSAEGTATITKINSLGTFIRSINKRRH